MHSLRRLLVVFVLLKQISLNYSIENQNITDLVPLKDSRVKESTVRTWQERNSEKTIFLLVCTVDGNIHAVEPETGLSRWSISLGQPLVDSFTSLDAETDGVAVPGDDGSLYIYTKNKELQMYDTSIPELVELSPTVQDVEGIGPLVIIGEYSSIVYTIDSETGEVLLTASVRPQSREESSFSSIIKDKAALINFAKRIYTVRAFQQFTGKEVWNFTYTTYEAPGEGIPLQAERKPGNKLTLEDIPISAIFTVRKPLTRDEEQMGKHNFCRIKRVDSVVPNALPLLPLTEKGVELVEFVANDGNERWFGTKTPPRHDLPKYLTTGMLELPAPDQEVSKMLKLDRHTPKMHEYFKRKAYPFSTNQTCLAEEEKQAAQLSRYKLLENTEYEGLYDMRMVVLLAVIMILGFAGYGYKMLYKRRNFSTNALTHRRASEIWLDDNTLRIGGLTVFMNQIKGRGCHGTIVYCGKLGRRPVAVKRMLASMYDLANKEVELLIQSDGHQNVVRYFAELHCRNFVYLALELCSTTLENAVNEFQQHCKRNTDDLELHVESSVVFLRELLDAVSHLHSLHIIHYDIKPQNILVTQKAKVFGTKQGFGELWRPKISDMGLSKKISANTSSTGTVSSLVPEFRSSSLQTAGTVGWRAPEILLKLARNKGKSVSLESRSKYRKRVDIFSLGCVFFYTLTLGEHPYGDLFERENLILNGEPKRLAVLKCQPEAKDLVTQMICLHPDKRPSIKLCKEHPFLWEPQKKLEFLCQLSNRLKLELQTTQALKKILEKQARKVFAASGWYEGIDQVFQNDIINGMHTYNCQSVVDLLRFIRNKYSHIDELCELDKIGQISTPANFYRSFSKQFPNLFFFCFLIVVKACSHEPQFRRFLGDSTIKYAQKESKIWKHSISPSETSRALDMCLHRSWFPTKSRWVDSGCVVRKHKRKSEKSKKTKYKVSLCNHWERTYGSWCAKGKQCNYAHGLHELRHKRYAARERAVMPWRETDAVEVKVEAVSIHSLESTGKEAL